MIVEMNLQILRSNKYKPYQTLFQFIYVFINKVPNEIKIPIVK